MRMSLVSMICGTAFVWSTAVIGQEVKGEFSSPKTDEEMIANALSAAPESIGKNATVIAFDANGKVRTLRKGTNNFTCIPDDPTNPANDPNCVDANGLEWVMAWVNKSEPPKGKVGFGYMLQGGTTPSNVDPFATKPPEGMKWMQEPPHVMVFNYGGEGTIKDYPRPGEMADMTQPWVMWAGSPYEHLMMPVGGAQ
ncbi:hypothetical protein [Mesorhizobium mediterraneum]|uniref:hypothetical protein n=1 Tax=Mesorhizobium mediterraneum TaxID=43617 RepID=UPI001FEF1E31|nr:hypothetical protein [Mesorhizobium mediterraneum]